MKMKKIIKQKKKKNYLIQRVIKIHQKELLYLVKIHPIRKKRKVLTVKITMINLQNINKKIKYKIKQL